MRLAVAYLLGIVTALAGGCAGAVYPGLQHARRSQRPIFVGNIGADNPDKNGDISALIQFFNTSAKTYKYIDISVEAYNRVGDLIRRDSDTSPIVKLRFTGPLAPRRTPGITTWPRVWHTNTIACLDIKRIDIIHMDGTTIAIEGPALADVLSKKMQRMCAHT